jgi:hypothetical protein
MDGVPDIGQPFLELICGLGWQATEEVLEVGEGIDVVMLTGPSHRLDTNRQPRGARRSDDTEAFSGMIAVKGRQSPGVERPPAKSVDPSGRFMT